MKYNKNIAIDQMSQKGERYGKQVLGIAKGKATPYH